MKPKKETYIIWDNQKEDIILYYKSNTGVTSKALFTNMQLAEDAISNISSNENRRITDFSICKIGSLIPNTETRAFPFNW